MLFVAFSAIVVVVVVVVVGVVVVAVVVVTVDFLLSFSDLIFSYGCIFLFFFSCCC